MHILYNFQSGPYGGGNQFLQALRREFRQKGYYKETPEEADIILGNANPGSLLKLSRELLHLKRHASHKIVLLRVDGPIARIRGSHERRTDLFTAQLVSLFADGVIFQSRWSQNKNKQLYAITAPHERVILNAPDPAIFYPLSAAAKMRPRARIKVIATSWSHHWRKGFAAYQYLDQNLDFSRYEMTFVGNSPINFKNIQSYPPVDSRRLAELLREHHIYITASMNDPCSNAVAEALACGLPVAAKQSGGHAELIGNGGLLFSTPPEALQAIETIAQKRRHFCQQIPTYNLTTAAHAYYHFAQSIQQKAEQGLYQPKRISTLTTSQNFLQRLRYRLIPL